LDGSNADFQRSEGTALREWYVLRAKPKREALAAGLLGRAGLEIYFPQLKVVKGAGRPTTVEPLFPCYLFGRLDPDLQEIRLASYTSGIQYVLGYDREPYSVPDSLVAAIKERVARNRGMAALPEFRRGESVVITDGLLRDLEAVFDRNVSKTGRARVLIQILGHIWPAEVHVGQLRPAKNAKGRLPASLCLS
jgi:transcriptional antiterminator RfaH